MDVAQYLIALSCIIVLVVLGLDLTISRQHQSNRWAYAAFIIFFTIGIVIQTNDGNRWVVALLMFTAAAHPLQYIIPMPAKDQA